MKILQNTSEIKSNSPVKYSLVDLSAHTTAKKLDRLRTAESYEDVARQASKAMDQLKIANFCLGLLEKTDGQIESQRVIRNIIDEQFKSTQLYFILHLSIFILAYTLPLYIQIYSSDEATVRRCLIVCLVI